LKSSRPVKKEVKTLEEYMRTSKNKEAKTYDFLKKTYENIVSGKIVLIDPSPPKDFLEYLLRLDYSLWLWTIIVLTALTVLTVALTSIIPWVIYFRYVVGSIAVLFMPGYVTVEALYPGEQDLTQLERLALSIGLSLAIVPLLGLILNYMPWGIRLEPVLISLSLYTVIVALIASYRKYHELSEKQAAGRSYMLEELTRKQVL